MARFPLTRLRPVVYGYAMGGSKKNPTQIRVALIEEHLRAFGLNVTKLIALSGIGRRTWYRWRDGVTEPNPRMWRKVENALPEGLKERIA